MTHGTHERQVAEPRVRDVEVSAGDLVLSGLAAVPVEPPRGLLLALHGGGSRAAYWHREAAPASSLPLLAAAAGWATLAVDRPGYGATAGLARDRQGLARQVEVMYALVDRLLAGAEPGLSCGGGIVVVGHSMGGILTLRMGADPRAGRLLGAAVSAIPLRHTSDRTAQLAAVPTGGEVVPPIPALPPDHYFGPPGTYDPVLVTKEGRIAAPVPMAEFLDARDTPKTLPGVLAEVTLPVQWTVAEYERSHFAGPAVLDETPGLLARAPVVECHLQRGAGHNISLHHTARAYHLRVLAFAEECLAASAPA